MFKAARWRDEKNKIKTVFKLQFQATQVPQLGWDTLMVSIVPPEVTTPSVKTEKATVHDGVCRWEKPIYETVNFCREPKTGKIDEKIYQILVLTGSSKGGIFGEVTIDFANYAEAIKPSSVSLPLKTPNYGTVLHVTIQRIQADREKENGDVILRTNSRTLKSHLSIGDGDRGRKYADDTINSIYITDNTSITEKAHLIVAPNKTSSLDADSNGIYLASSGSDAISGSSLANSSEENTPKENGSKRSNVHHNMASFLPFLNKKVTAQNIAHQRSNSECSVSSDPDGSEDDSLKGSRNTFSEEVPQGMDDSLEKLKNDLIVSARQAEVLEVELQTLRKQIVKESRRGQELSKEVCSLKEDREALNRECKQLRATQQKMNKLQFDSGDPRYILEEIRQELNYEKELNANLRLQLQKTQESNSQLIFAVKDLEELLEHKYMETLHNSFSPTAVRLPADQSSALMNGSYLLQSKSLGEGKALETVYKQETVEDKLIYALQGLVKEQDNAKPGYALEQKLLNLSSEIEVYKKEREELEGQIQQLALDYEILKQQNHELSSKLEQSELKEQLQMQYENSASLAVVSELEAHLESLEKDLRRQAEAFEADLAEVARAKVEQEQRAIRAEEALRKMRLNNANTAERLQEEFRRLSVQMSSTFEVNEKLAVQAQVEARELRLEKSQLQELLEKVNGEFETMKDWYEEKVEEIRNQMNLKANETDQLMSELGEKTKDVENQKRCSEARQKDLLDEIQMLQSEIEVLTREKNDLSDLVKQKEISRAEMERLKIELKEERERTNTEREALNEMKRIADEKETTLFVLQSEIETLSSQYNDLKHSLFEDELEKENLRKQVFHLRGDLRKKEDAIATIEKKLKESSVRATASDGIVKTSPKNNNKSSPPSHGSKEALNLREKIKVLQREINLKETALENLSHSFLKKERKLQNRIEELQKCSAEISQNKPSFPEENTKKDDTESNNGLDRAQMGRTTRTELEKNIKDPAGQGDKAELLSEMALLKERNKLMETELKDMQERYSEISLKFAEVEGERQHLVMTIRNLKNSKKS